MTEDYLQKLDRECRESKQMRMLAIWNLIIGGITFAVLVFHLDNSVGIGFGVALILLSNAAALFDHRQRIKKIVADEKMRRPLVPEE